MSDGKPTLNPTQGVGRSARWHQFINSAPILWMRGYDEPDPVPTGPGAISEPDTAPLHTEPTSALPATEATFGEPKAPTTTSASYPSAELLLTLALDDRQARIGTLDALQTKVGVMLALASALVVLADSWDQTRYRVASAIPSALAALICLANLFTRGVEFTDMRAVRKYASMEPSASARRLYDTIVAKDRQLRRSLTLAGRTVNTAGLLLLAATAVNVVALLLDSNHPPTP